MNTVIGLSSDSNADIALKSVNIHAKLTGVLAEVDVKQCYQNNHNTNIETVYTFPLPLDAILLQLTVDINGHKLKGQVKVNAQAEDDYEDAITNGDTAVMLKKISDGLYSINLGNLMPNEKAVIHFKYAQLNQWQGERLRFYIPTTLAPKYGSALAAGIAEHEVPTHSLAANYQFEFTADIEGQLADATIISPTHSIKNTISKQGLHLELADRFQPMDRDLVIEVSKPQHYLGEGLWAKDDDKIVALTSFYPQINPTTESQPRCIKMLVDCSGSMCGDSIVQARIALQAILRQLESNDWFNIILFGSGYSKMFNEAVQATPTNLQHAKAILTTLQANLGGTEIGGALTATYNINSPSNMPTDILLITDGQIWNENPVIVRAKKSEHRHFVVGVGSAVSEAFLSKLANETGGASEFVTPNENMSQRIVRHFERVKQPKLINAHISWPQNHLLKTQTPQQLTNLFAQDTVNVFTWLAAAKNIDEKINLSFITQNTAVKYNQAINVTYSESSTIARLAAHARLAEVTDEEALYLAEKYQLITPATSYILVKENEHINEFGLPHLQAVPHQLPAGQHGLGSAINECHHVLCLGEAILEAPISLKSDYLDIPMFLRKNPVKHHSLAATLNHKYTPGNDVNFSEFSIKALDNQGEDEAITERLYQLVDDGHNEQQLVVAWLSIYNEFAPYTPLSRHVTRLSKMQCKALKVSQELINIVRTAITAVNSVLID
ncbi:VIT domain-containing protein [Shewanella gaetbuli]